MYKKFIFILSVFILIFSFFSFSFAADPVPGLVYDIPESPDFPNHTYIFIYERYMGDSNDGVYLIKYYMPIVLVDRSTPTVSSLRLDLSNALYYKYNFDDDAFYPVGTLPYNVGFDGIFQDVDRNNILWNDTSVTYSSLFPLAANHNIEIDDGTLFFWTPQMSQDSPQASDHQLSESSPSSPLPGVGTGGGSPDSSEESKKKAYHHPSKCYGSMREE